MNKHLTTDVAIVGAGLAGLAAALACQTAGLRTIVLEATNRTGGRVNTGTWPNSNTQIDWGAEWIIPSMHHDVMAIITKAGLTLEVPEATSIAKWVLNTRTLTTSFRQLRKDNTAFSKALDAIETDARSFASPVTNHPIKVDAAVSTYLRSLSPDKDTGDLLEAAIFPLTGAGPTELSTHMLWREIDDHGGSVDATLDADACRIQQGCGTLCGHIVSKLSLPILMSNPVTSIHDQAASVTVVTAHQNITAHHCIVATPLRTLSSIQFAPPLNSAMKDTAVQSNAGRTAKVWAEVTCTEKPGDVYQTHARLRYGYSRQISKRRWLLCGQILSTPERPLSHVEATAELKAAWPTVEIHALDIVDWPNVPFAKASWHSSRAGWAEKTKAFNRPHGNIHFAGGDIAPRWSGWMEGALLSGKAVANQVIAQST